MKRIRKVFCPKQNSPVLRFYPIAHPLSTGLNHLKLNTLEPTQDVQGGQFFLRSLGHNFSSANPSSNLLECRQNPKKKSETSPASSISHRMTTLIYLKKLFSQPEKSIRKAKSLTKFSSAIGNHNFL